MKGIFFVKRLNKTGNYLSSLDDNPIFGELAKEVIVPVLNSDGKREIRYVKEPNGYLVSGEAYIVTGTNEKEINRKAKTHYEKWENLIHTECANESELW